MQRNSCHPRALLIENRTAFIRIIGTRASRPIHGIVGERAAADGQYRIAGRAVLGGAKPIGAEDRTAQTLSVESGHAAAAAALCRVVRERAVHDRD